MSGSGASNYGYGNITPNSNVNPTYVNVDGSNYPGGFGTDVIPKSIHSLQAPPDNIVAASGTWTGNGGRKNIHKVYKSMKAGRRKSTRAKSLKRFSKSGKRKLRVKKSRKIGGKHAAVFFLEYLWWIPIVPYTNVQGDKCFLQIAQQLRS